MNLVSWNLGHRQVPKVLTDGVIEGILSFKADVIILNEFCPREADGTHKRLCERLDVEGYRHYAISPRNPCPKSGVPQNQVFIASKERMIEQTDGPLSAPDHDYAESGWLHVVFPERNMELIGLRVPSPNLIKYWSSLRDTLLGVGDRRMIVMGDLNVERERESHKSRNKCLMALEAQDWNIPRAGGSEYSCYRKGHKPSRIDHVLLRGVEQTSVEYVKERVVKSRRFQFIGDSLSDHTPLEVIVKDEA
jgi:endonuclease/exonuclease/phosphatase family metal-dependent hydrolase